MMSARTLLIVIPSRYYITEDGVWTTTSYNYDMWAEGLVTWDSITVAALCLYEQPPKGATRADGSCVSFLPLVNSRGVLGGIGATPSRFIGLRSAIQTHSASALHVPSDLGTLAWAWCRFFGKPYGIDVRGSQSLDPTYLRRRGIALSRLVTTAFDSSFEQVRRDAICGIYVSDELLRCYPLKSGRKSFVASDIRLPLWWFTKPRSYPPSHAPVRLIVVGRLDQGKGLDTLLVACAQVSNSHQSDFCLEIVGDGPIRDKLVEETCRLGIADRVDFTGFIPWGRDLHQKLLNADVFVFASLSEGMPRVIIEAMAVGLPVISTAVGGVPELLVDDDLVATNDAEAMAISLADVLTNPTRRAVMSERNYMKSLEFHPDHLRSIKQAFYEEIAQSI